ncbi:glutamyl-tRNA reductase [Zooshikella harenae]|uniref:Glutamyl-tRNA reductase n=1 Tax=Zooshikella harenae TaxID=2827238 RepID=A0ABS5ZEA0_9GAMM|nr:glutamyl-tRNA reductase [Zooshikella harenae]MBU2711282.1 glutamyl-tRNA reductase [Zooshikella harenae]
MGFLALGINHNTASIAMRERVSFTPERLQDALLSAQKVTGVRETAILSTCNRTEIYCSLDQVQPSALLHWLSEYHHLHSEDMSNYTYCHLQEQAVQHLIRVACGLDSMVLGEPQILGQIKTAYAQAQEAGTVGPALRRLFQTCFAVAKQVRTQTTIGQNPVSVAYAAVSLARQIFADLSETSVLLIGAGETIELVARHLFDTNVKTIIFANRTLDRAAQLADKFNAQSIALADIPDYLAKVDIVIASTASQLPVLGKGATERALKIRKHRPMFMVDLAVPRDIEPEVSELADVYLYTVDDLREVINENVRQREQAASEAEKLVIDGAAEFMLKLKELDAIDVLKAIRRKADMLKEAELEKAQRQLKNGADPEAVLAQFARALTNKLTHAPSVQIKKAGAEGRMDLVNWAQHLFETDQ